MSETGQPQPAQHAVANSATRSAMHWLLCVGVTRARWLPCTAACCASRWAALQANAPMPWSHHSHGACRAVDALCSASQRQAGPDSPSLPCRQATPLVRRGQLMFATCVLPPACRAADAVCSGQLDAWQPCNPSRVRVWPGPCRRACRAAGPEAGRGAAADHCSCSNPGGQPSSGRCARVLCWVAARLLRM